MIKGKKYFYLKGVGCNLKLSHVMNLANENLALFRKNTFTILFKYILLVLVTIIE